LICVRDLFFERRREKRASKIAKNLRSFLGLIF
jgi:hypothetical protein